MVCLVECWSMLVTVSIENIVQYQPPLIGSRGGFLEEVVQNDLDFVNDKVALK